MQVEYIEGRGKVVDAHTVEVEGKQYTVRCPSHYLPEESCAASRMHAIPECPTSTLWSDFLLCNLCSSELYLGEV